MSDGMTEMTREAATGRQVGGDHYRKYPIQPAEYSTRNGLSFLAGNVVKYVTRYKDKGGAEDIRKALHYLELILEFEYPTALYKLGEVIDPPPTNPASPVTARQLACDQDGYQTLYATPAGPALILKLESEDPDTVGDLYGESKGRLSGRRPKGQKGLSDE